MARRLFTSGTNALIDFLASLDLRAALVTSGYTFAVADDALNDVGGANIIASGADLTLSRIAAPNGAALDVANFSFPSVPAGSTIDGVIIYQEGATDADRVLWGYIDEDSSAVAISVPTNGNNVNVTIPAAGLLALTDSNAP